VTVQKLTILTYSSRLIDLVPMTRDCSSFGSPTAGPVQTGPFGGAPLQTNLFGCALNRLAIPWFHFESTFAKGNRDPWHKNSDKAMGHPLRFFVGHSWMVCRPQKRSTHSEHPGEPKIETWPSLFWIDVWTASDRATRWALVTFGFGFWLHWWRRCNASIEMHGREDKWKRENRCLWGLDLAVWSAIVDEKDTG